MLVGLVLNGWQQIERVEGNTMPSFGTQIQFKPNDRVVLNSSTFIGANQPDVFRRMRYFHDFYGIFQLSDQWEATIGFDVGWEQRNHESSDYSTWYTPVFILRYAPNAKFAIAARGETYRDKDGVIISTNIFNGFDVWGLSLNFDYAITPNAVWRIEARNLNSSLGIFPKGANTITAVNTCLTTSLAVSF